MSVTEPTTPGAARGGRSGRAKGEWGAIAARVESLSTSRNAALLLVLGGAAVLGAFLARPSYPNYDSYYTLIWGQELASGELPDYDVLRPPTPHPLATLLAAGLSGLGGAADRALVLLSLGFHVALLATLFRFTQLLVGTLVAVLAVLALLTRTDLEFLSLRAVVDVPFLALVFGAAVLEIERPRRGWPVLVLLVLAGLLRPEAWALAGVYVLWLGPALPRRRLMACIALAALAPVLWLLSDLIVTGDPLYSLTSTRDVAGQFDRQRSVPEAIGKIPDFVGGNEKVVNVAAGGLGLLLGLWLLRRRAAVPLALGGISVAVFLAIAAAGLSVIPRYLVIPSLIFNVGVALALGGWTLLREPRARWVGLAVALLALLLVAWRVPAYVKDAEKLDSQTSFVTEQHRDLKAILDDPRLVPLLRTCTPITVPTHSAIPVIRYETGLGPEALEASIERSRPPDRGVLLIGRTFNFEPAAARTTVGTNPRSAQKPWSNEVQPGFRLVASHGRWRAYARCV